LLNLSVGGGNGRTKEGHQDDVRKNPQEDSNAQLHNTLRPVLQLIAEKLTMIEDNKTRFITIELPTSVNAPAGSATYEQYIRKFEEGTGAQEWIDLQRDIQEIWVQNAITGGTDRA
jgi:hypothetical protein